MQNANIYSHYSSPSNNVYNIDGDITINQTARYTFWTLGWRFKNQNHGGYFGIQTSRDPSKFKIIGSIWNAVSAAAITPAVATPFGGEGIGYSVKTNDVPIIPGRTYKLRLWRGEITANHVEWMFFIIDTATNKETLIGKIKALPTDIEIDSTSLYNFSEYYGSDINDCSIIPKSIVTWKYPTILADSFTERVASTFIRPTIGSCSGKPLISQNNGTSIMSFGG